MAAPRERSAPLEFRFRRLQKPEEFRAAEKLQTEAWGLVEEPPVPSPLQRALQDNGGMVLGAFLDIHLVGMTIGFLGWDGEKLYQYCHMAAVRPQYQNHQVGFRLMAFHREEVLRQGLDEIRWTFDPLRSRNAMLHVRRLGGLPDRYLVDYYGQMGSAANRDPESDRLRLVWRLEDPAVVARIGGLRATPEEDERRLREAVPIVETEVGETGLRRPVQVSEPDGPSASLEIPFDLDALHQHDPKGVSVWRHAVRDAFRAAFDLGYRVTDFAVVRAEHERRSFYFLASGPPAAPAPRATSDAPGPPSAPVPPKGPG
jgi:predicted GNAT superfamily acetyltransferase